jgi:CHRD domain-containing protein
MQAAQLEEGLARMLERLGLDPRALDGGDASRALAEVRRLREAAHRAGTRGRPQPACEHVSAGGVSPQRWGEDHPPLSFLSPPGSKGASLHQARCTHADHGAVREHLRPLRRHRADVPRHASRDRRDDDLHRPAERGPGDTPNTSNASGIAFLTFDGKQLCFAITTTIGSQETAAHIHGPAAPGEAAGILFTLDAGRAKNGCWSSPAKSVKKALKKGRLYLNVHTNEFPNGEIRGQILKTK